jgi:uncharacterized protein
MRGSDLGLVGIGWRRELAADLLARRDVVDFVEVVAETCFTQSVQRREAVALSRVWPVIPHGVKLSLGSADGIDEDRARRLGDLARELRAPFITEHVALTSAGETEIGHLTQLPRTRLAVSVVARNVARARKHLPDVPLVLENIAWTLRWPDDEMSEEDFYAEVSKATGCPMLLDLGNLYANALNEGRDPLAVLRGYPLDRVAQVHLAGGHRDGDFYFDDHASPVPDEVFALLRALVDARGAVPCLLERDANYPPFAELAAELDRARALVEQAAQKPTARPEAPRDAALFGDLDVARYAAHQRDLAKTLTGREAPDETFSPFDIARSRDVLQRKRIDDALPLLARLAPHGARLEDVARRAVETHPRPPRGAALSDAWTIATEAARDPVMAGDARVDLLVLRARFNAPRRPGEAPTERAAPFVGSAATRSGRRVWAVKGLGATARVRLYERP